MPKAKTVRRDPMIWMARRLREALEQQRQTEGDGFDVAVQRLLHHQDQVARRWRRSCTAAARSWRAAAAAERRLLVDLVESSHHPATEVLACHERSVATSPSKVQSLAGIVAELRQLQEEFDEVEIDRRRGILAVVTRPVTLEGIRLGPFRLELAVSRLRDLRDVTAVKCVALEPNPASLSEDTTHPHVQYDTLCAGDATAPLNAALRDGRVCDVMLLINAVLHTYNGASPYVSLDDWSGVSCPDCSDTTDENSLYGCERCGNRYCEGCIGVCDGCDGSFCHSCLERIDRGDHLCPGCRAVCPRCDRLAPTSEVEELGMCRGCREEEDEQQLELQEQEDHEHEDDDDEEGAANVNGSGQGHGTADGGGGDDVPVEAPAA